jgi:hypothetical protein
MVTMELFRSVRRFDHQTDVPGTLEAICLEIIRITGKFNTLKNKNEG